MTAFATVESAVEAMRLGADDYIAKPFSVKELLARVDRAARAADPRVVRVMDLKTPGSGELEKNLYTNIDQLRCNGNTKCQDA